jgi:hypothetical protein
VEAYKHRVFCLVLKGRMLGTVYSILIFDYGPTCTFEGRNEGTRSPPAAEPSPKLDPIARSCHAPLPGVGRDISLGTHHDMANFARVPTICFGMTSALSNHQEEGRARTNRSTP